MIKQTYDKKILIVDDDLSILTMVETVLKKEGYTHVRKASNGEGAVSAASDFHPDLVILDVMLPDLDGYEVCRQIRQFSMVPILFLSARSDEADRLVSYASGGDEYMMKPFSIRELLAKIGAILRRQQYYQNPDGALKTYQFGGFTLDLEKQMLFRAGKYVNLTAKEYGILEYLVRNKNITVSKDQILAHVWETAYEGYDNTVMVHIRHLREKIEENPARPVYIKTVKGRGYVFEG
jgi:DNA-binding response OmpR family regulator